MGLPFGMIFAIFLIVVFIVIAFMVAKSFLNLGKSATVGTFYKSLQKTVDTAIQSQESNSNFKVDLPSSIKEICFANLSSKITNSGENYDAIKNYDVYDANVFLIPPEKAQGMQWKRIRRINITKITEHENPYCVKVSAGLKIHKGFYDRLVWIS